VLAVLLRPPDTFLAILAITVLGPLAEEIAKVALPLYAVEKRPFWFIVPVQIVVASVGSALCFAAIENVLYLKVYVPSPTPGLVIWRWTICVVLHTSCSLIASLGLVRVWHDVHETKQRPDLRRAVPFLIAAVVVHGVYNAGAVLAEAVNYQF
jgi:RsiW-degrading membrane proteinase PrsW (M82 family)